MPIRLRAMKDLFFSKETGRWFDLDVALKILRGEIGPEDLRCIKLIFSPEWYVVKYPDAAKSSLRPLVHYLNTGAAKGYDPGPLFDAGWYLHQYAEAAQTGGDPLLHYLRTGAAEGLGQLLEPEHRPAR